MDAAATVALLYERTGDPVVVRRPGEPDRQFQAFMSSADELLLGSSVVAASHALTFPSAAGQLEEGDEIEHAGARYPVLEDSRRIRDGHESQAPLATIPA